MHWGISECNLTLCHELNLTMHQHSGTPEPKWNRWITRRTFPPDSKKLSGNETTGKSGLVNGVFHSCSTLWNVGSLDPRHNPQGRVWGEKPCPEVFGVLECCLRCWWGKEHHSSQPALEHRNFENQSSTWPIALIWKRKFAKWNCGIPARHFRARLFPRPFLTGWVWDPD